MIDKSILLSVSDLVGFMYIATTNIPILVICGGCMHAYFMYLFASFRCRHKNLVDLVGYCSNPSVLVYEYMEVGNLHNRMFKTVTMSTFVLMVFYKVFPNRKGL